MHLNAMQSQFFFVLLKDIDVSAALEKSLKMEKNC